MQPVARPAAVRADFMEPSRRQVEHLPRMQLELEHARLREEREALLAFSRRDLAREIGDLAEARRRRAVMSTWMSAVVGGGAARSCSLSGGGGGGALAVRVLAFGKRPLGVHSQLRRGV